MSSSKDVSSQGRSMKDSFRKRLAALRIVGIYALVSLLWIYTSDTVLGWLVPDSRVMVKIAIYKGSLFIVLTSLLLYVLLRRYHRHLSDSEQALKVRVKSLHVSEERLSLALIVTNSGIWDWNVKTGAVYFNPNYFRLSGYEPDEFPHTYDEWEKRVHPADVERAKTAIAAYLSGESGAYAVEFRFEKKDGSWMWVLSQGQIFERDEKGDPVRFTGTHTDISKRKRVEEALLESECRWKFAIEGSGVGVWDWNIQTDEAKYSKLWKEMLGYAESDILPTNQEWVDRIHPDDQSYVAGTMRAYLDGKTASYVVEYRLRCKDESYKWILGRGMVVSRCEDGRPLRMIGTHTDITERMQAEQQLIDTMNYNQTLLRTSPVGISTYKATGETVTANESAARIVGTTIETLTQQNFRNIDSWKTYGVLEVAERALATGVEQRADLHVITTFGNRVDLDCLFVPFTFGGEPHLMLTMMDITERKEHEKEQLKIEKLESLGVLAGGIAHDFNNILTGIMGNISFAEMFLDATHKAYKPLVEAEKASVRATELAHQLLTFARGGEPIKKVVSLQHLVRESISFMLHGSNVVGIVDIPDSIHAIEADEGQMSQVFHNIIINATHAMPGGGTLTVTAQNKTLRNNNALSLPSGTYIRLLFTDQGCGIPDDDLKKIFDPYFTTKLAGNGLGLASANSIISRHGGHIGASSVVGKGTTFTIHLPSIGETYSKYQTNSVAHTVGVHTGGSILVMDDEKIIRDMTTEMLEYLGYQATTCENGAEAVIRYKTAKESGSPFLAVIVDLTIPGGMGGREAARQILAIDPAACLVVSSGYSTDPIMSDYGAYGFASAVAKPYKMNELGQLLSSLFSK